MLNLFCNEYLGNPSSLTFILEILKILLNLHNLYLFLTECQGALNVLSTVLRTQPNIRLDTFTHCFQLLYTYIYKYIFFYAADG